MTRYYCDKCGRDLTSLAGGRYQARITCSKLLGCDSYTADFCKECITGIVGAEVIKLHEEKERERKERAAKRKEERERAKVLVEHFANPYEDTIDDTV